MCYFHGGIFHKHCALNSFTFNPPDLVAYVSLGEQINVTMPYMLGCKLSRYYQLPSDNGMVNFL
jgi:hypothetical protein